MMRPNLRGYALLTADHSDTDGSITYVWGNCRGNRVRHTIRYYNEPNFPACVDTFENDEGEVWDSYHRKWSHRVR